MLHEECLWEGLPRAEVVELLQMFGETTGERYTDSELAESCWRLRQQAGPETRQKRQRRHKEEVAQVPGKSSSAAAAIHKEQAGDEAPLFGAVGVPTPGEGRSATRRHVVYGSLEASY